MKKGCKIKKTQSKINKNSVAKKNLSDSKKKKKSTVLPTVTVKPKKKKNADGVVKKNYDRGEKPRGNNNGRGNSKSSEVKPTAYNGF